ELLTLDRLNGDRPVGGRDDLEPELGHEARGQQCVQLVIFDEEHSTSAKLGEVRLSTERRFEPRCCETRSGRRVQTGTSVRAHERDGERHRECAAAAKFASHLYV